MSNQIEEPSFPVEPPHEVRMPKWVVAGAWAAGITVALFYLYYSITLANIQDRQLPFGSIIVGFFLYTLPTWLASRRNHEKVFTIAAVNVLLGWTLIGWAAALRLGLREPDVDQERSSQ